MKRPSGFDRGPEPRGRKRDRAEADAAGSDHEQDSARDAESVAPGTGEPGSNSGGSGAGSGGSGAGSLFGRRREALRERRGAEEPPAGSSADSAAGFPADSPADSPAAPADEQLTEEIAPTIDLDSVRSDRADEAGNRFARALASSPAPDADEAAGIGGSGIDDQVTTELAPLKRSGGGGVGGALARLQSGRSERAADPVRAAERRLREAGKARKARFKRERRRFSAEARRRRRSWLIAGGAVLALALFVLIGVFTPLTAVKEIRVEGVSAVPKAEVNTALKRFEGVPLALVNDSEVHDALEKFPRIQRYAVERIPPSTLVVRIEERTPVMAIKEGGSFAVLDAAGVVLSTSKEAPQGVPVGSGALTDRSSVAFRTSATSLRDIPDALRGQIATVQATSGQDVTFGLTSGVSVVWGDAAESRYKALVLETTLKSLAQQNRPVSQIDVSSPGAPVFR